MFLQNILNQCVITFVPPCITKSTQILRVILQNLLKFINFIQNVFDVLSIFLITKICSVFHGCCHLRERLTNFPSFSIISLFGYGIFFGSTYFAAPNTNLFMFLEFLRFAFKISLKIFFFFFSKFPKIFQNFQNFLKTNINIFQSYEYTSLPFSEFFLKYFSRITSTSS